MQQICAQQYVTQQMCLQHCVCPEPREVDLPRWDESSESDAVDVHGMHCASWGTLNGKTVKA